MGDLHTYYSGIHADGANAVWNVVVAMPKGKERVLEDFSSGAEVTWPHLTTGGPFYRSSLPFGLGGALLSGRLPKPLGQKVLHQFEVALPEMIMSKEEKGTGRDWKYFFLGNLPQKPPVAFSGFAGKNCLMSVPKPVTIGLEIAVYLLELEVGLPFPWSSWL